MPALIVRRQAKAAVGLQRKKLAWYTKQPSARDGEDPQEVNAARPMSSSAEIKGGLPSESRTLAPGAALAGTPKNGALLRERKAGDIAQKAFRKMDVLHVLRHGVTVGEHRGERRDA